MLEVSTLRSPNKADRAAVVGDHLHHHVVGFPAPPATDEDDDTFIVDDCSLLDYIDFSCCDVPFFHADDGDILPDLEVDPTDELLAEFESSPGDEARTTAASTAESEPAAADCCGGTKGDVKEDGAADESSPLPHGKKDLDQLDEVEAETTKEFKNGDDEVLSAVTSEDSPAAAGCDAKSSAPPAAEGHSKRKASSSPTTTTTGKNSHGKRKVKVDWTPELHRRFVQAVEQLGIDKAVPSRILELMGIECLTRHNIASHLQKYRSHRKHLMAREAEAVSWTQKRQMYTAAAAQAAARGEPGKDAAGVAPWVVPTIGFPPPPHVAAAMPAPPAAPPFCRPLHVWGHPTPGGAEATPPQVPVPPPLLPVWPRHLAPPPQLQLPLPAAWAHHRHPAPVVDPAYWQQPQYYNVARKWGLQPVTPGTPCLQPQMPPPALLQRFPAPPVVPGMVPHPMYIPIPPQPLPPPSPGNKLAALQLQLDAHPVCKCLHSFLMDTSYLYYSS
ncbi:hypothetical protein GUJ93_ZPchr0008g12631 [Zizania palustris]|uniref:HTH myb-type domain-containing protein n=1 Tax=Zizania palustris TaxID=103762 RepID=A0A8J5RGU4_ZIZPA|nr:hypothetical protein GUJ93_ZPchr0008g12631 [Zizania palustris]